MVSPETEMSVIDLVIAGWPPAYRSFGAVTKAVPEAEPAGIVTTVPPVSVTVTPPWPVTGSLVSSLIRVTV
ncbi:hypothetical protein D3C81_1611000 [compost metagenome]